VGPATILLNGFPWFRQSPTDRKALAVTKSLANEEAQGPPSMLSVPTKGIVYENLKSTDISSMKKILYIFISIRYIQSIGRLGVLSRKRLRIFPKTRR
jgi:hypothetical protein